jgi:DNA-binding IclR family transcriptional regulator
MKPAHSPGGSSRPRKQPKRTANLKTVDKALNTLDFLGIFGGQVGVRELAEYLAINKSSTHRLLTTLESHGYVAQDPHTGKYQLGIRLFQVGAVVLSQTNLCAAARPHLQRLAEETGEVVHLVIENGGQCLYVDKVTGAQAIPTGSALGWRRPLYCTGVGKALLAHLPAQRREQIVYGAGLRSYTPNTITDPFRLEAELEEIRATGVAHDREEMEVGLRCVAVPVVDAEGRVVAAISVAGPTARFGPDDLPHLIELVRSAAAGISRDLAVCGAGRGSRNSTGTD